MSPFLTRDQAAEALQVSINTIDRWIAAGALPVADLPGRIIRIPREAVEGVKWRSGGRVSNGLSSSSKQVSVFSDGYPLRRRKPRRKS
jgi:excisionase family DNA binding protein